MLFKTVASTTGGRLSVMERTLPPGGRMPPSHVHDGDEAYFVLDEVVTFRIGGEEFQGRRDTFVHVPGGVEHTFGKHVRRSCKTAGPARARAGRVLPRLGSALVVAGAAVEDEDRDLMRRHGVHPSE